MRKPTEEQIKEMRDVIQPYREQVSNTPALLSLLYDIDLLPEQIRLPVNASRMIAICAIFKVLTPEQVSSLFEAQQPID